MMLWIIGMVQALMTAQVINLAFAALCITAAIGWADARRVMWMSALLYLVLAKT